MLWRTDRALFFGVESSQKLYVVKKLNKKTLYFSSFIMSDNSRRKELFEAFDKIKEAEEVSFFVVCFV